MLNLWEKNKTKKKHSTSAYIKPRQTADDVTCSCKGVDFKRYPLWLRAKGQEPGGGGLEWEMRMEPKVYFVL